MPAPEYRVISIGTLAAHPLWNESVDVRTGHATTTLITAGDANILVDPSLPVPVVEARLAERSPVRADDVTHVFLTSFTPDHYRGLMRFEDAEWLLSEPERDAARADFSDQRERADDAGDADLCRLIDDRLDILARCRVADDVLVPGVDLFPVPGVTPGACGLILPLPAATVLVCGDAIATMEHLEKGQVLPTCVDVEMAQASFRDAIDIADVIVPGRDNVVPNPTRQRY